MNKSYYLQKIDYPILWILAFVISLGVSHVNSSSVSSYIGLGKVEECYERRPFYIAGEKEVFANILLADGTSIEAEVSEYYLNLCGAAEEVEVDKTVGKIFKNVEYSIREKSSFRK